MTDAPTPTKSESERSAILSRVVADHVKKGWATETVSNTQAVLVKVKRIGWFWNLILVIITGGLWLIYIIYRALNRKTTRKVLFVNELGIVEER
jgi:hypothetical protein